MEKVYKVKINGIEYDILSDRTEGEIKKIEEYVNNKIINIVENNSGITVSVAAIITAMSIAEELILDKKASEIKKEQVCESHLMTEEYDEKNFLDEDPKMF